MPCNSENNDETKVEFLKTMAKERLIWADSLKGWLMILVILGHVMQQLAGGVDGGSHLWAMIYSFHMPAFIAASGWFAYRKNRPGGV